MNDVMRVLGRMSESDDVVPVVATVPTSRKMDGLKAQRRLDRLKARRQDLFRGESSLVSQVLGEGYDTERPVDPNEEEDAVGGVLPTDAEDLDGSELAGSVTAKLKRVVDEEPEVSEPQTVNREALIPPVTALTAPDSTPDAFTPLDPSKVPGAFSSNRFTSQDANKVPAAPSAAGADRTMQTMDTILGRDRSERFEQSGRIMTPESAAAMFNASAKSGKEILNEGVPMPEPTKTDSKKVMSAFRKFT